MNRLAILILLLISILAAPVNAVGDTPTSPTAAIKPTPAGPIAPPRRDVPGRRWELGPKRQVFVPGFFLVDGGSGTGAPVPKQIFVHF